MAATRRKSTFSSCAYLRTNDVPQGIALLEDAAEQTTSFDGHVLQAELSASEGRYARGEQHASRPHRGRQTPDAAHANSEQRADGQECVPVRCVHRADLQRRDDDLHNAERVSTCKASFQRRTRLMNMGHLRPYMSPAIPKTAAPMVRKSSVSVMDSEMTSRSSWKYADRFVSESEPAWKSYPSMLGACVSIGISR